MSLDLQNPITGTQFITNQQNKYVLTDESAKTQLSDSIQAIVRQNFSEFNALVQWFCKCTEQVMGSSTEEWQKPMVFGHQIAYGNEADVHFRYDVILGGLWKNVEQFEKYPESTHSDIAPFGLDTSLGLGLRDDVTRHLLGALASEFLLPSGIRGRVCKFGAFTDGTFECTYRPNGNMMIGFSVAYTADLLSYVNSGMKTMEGKSPNPRYVLSRTLPRVTDSIRTIAMGRVMSIDGSMI